MNKKDKIQILVNAITRLATAGFPLDASAVHYIDTLFSYPCAEDFRRMLLERDDSDTETLYDLLFFPDLEMQMQLEPVLEALHFDADEEASAIGLVQEKNIHARIRFPDSRGDVVVAIPAETVRRMILRLRITVSMDGRIIDTLQKLPPDSPDRYWIRVMLRNSRIPLKDPFVHVLCRCIESMAGSSAHFRPAFDLLVDFLETADPAKDIYTGLIQKKHQLAHLIFQAEKNERLLEKASVEALMLSGRRIPAIAVGDARKKIVLIDHLCLWVFGKTDLTE